MKTKIFFTVVFLLSFLSSYGENEVSAYVRIENNAFAPVAVTNSTKNGEQVLNVVSGNASFNAILFNAKIKKFEKAFPTIQNEWLDKVYIVVSDEEFINNLKQEGFRNAISHVETLCEPQLCYTPNDYSLALNQTNLDLIKVKDAWDIMGDIPRLPIGVTDTYFDTTHPDLQGQFIAVIGKGNTADFHGTSVAGILGAITNNGIGISSIGFGSKIYASTIWGIDNEVLEMAQMGYKIINCSWLNSCNYSFTQDTLYEYIRDNLNTVVVFGAGNNAGHCGSLSAKVYPASYSSVLSVTSVGHIFPMGHIDPVHGQVEWIDCHEEIVGDSNAGHHHNDAIDICAPGHKVPTTGCCGLDSYDYGWGTSFAAPHVAATVCLILSLNPCLTAEQAMNIVKVAADSSIYELPCNQAYIGKLGTGRLDVAKSCLLAAQTATKILNVPTIFNGKALVIANYAIKNTSSVLVKNSANVQFKARHNIELNAGFEVELGAVFSAEIDPNLTVNCQ